MAMSALLIHLSGGRIETHFHVFGSLAFLAFYRDWRVLVTGSVVVALDHFARGLFWPQSVFGVFAADSWRWAEHAGWVVFIDVFLVRSCYQSTVEMRSNADREASLDLANKRLEEGLAAHERSLNALRMSEERLRFVARATNDTVCDWDLVTNALWSNDGFQTMFGYRPEEIEPGIDSWTNRVHPEDKDRVLSGIHAVIHSGGEVWSGEYRFLRADGSYAHVLDRGFVIAGLGGHPERMVGSMMDITERERARTELVRAKALAEEADCGKSAALTQLGLQFAIVKKRDEALRELAAALENAVEGVARLDVRGRYEFVNLAYSRMLGYEPGEMIGMGWEATVHPDDIDEMTANLGELQAVGKTGAVTRGIKKDGSTFHKSVLLIRAPDRDGQPIGNFCFMKDVTESKRAEEQLSRLAAIVESSDDAIVGRSLDGVVTIWNAGAARLYGYPAEEMLGRPGTQILSPHDPDEVSRLLDRIRRGERIEHYEAVRLRRNGTRVAVSLTVSPVKDAAGAVVGLSMIGRDITESKRAEEQLKQGAARLAEAQRIARMGSWEWDIATNRTIWSDELYHLFGIDPQGYAATYEAFLEQVHPDDIEKIRGTIATCVRDDRPFSFDYRLRTRDGGDRVFTSVGRLITDETGTPVRMLGIGQDVTEARRAEAELRVAKEAAEAASRAKSEFLANMSHEIRTPMNGVLGMTELALDTDLTREQRGYLGTVKSSAEHLLGVINDVLDFSKIEAGKLDLDPHDFRLRDDLGDTMKAMTLRAHEKGLELACHVAPDAPDLLVGDALRLRQILVNLVCNAIKFTARGEVAVDVRVDGESPDGIRLRFAVRDTGIGIPADRQAAIFHAFTQADGSTTRQYGGTGLGLAISTQLVGLMGGELAVESAAGIGSTFAFTVPFGRSSEGAFKPVTRGVDLEELPVLAVVESRRLQILLAEDNEVNQELTVKLLEKRGHVVIVANNGREALSAMERGSFDAVLMDVQMPEMDGLTATAAIREGERSTGRHMPIVALTAHAMKGDRERCLAAGMDDYLTKPLRIVELVETLARLVPLAAESVGGAANGKPVEPDFDRRTALARVEGDRDLLRKMVQLFGRQSDTLLGEIGSAVGRNDGPALERAAHKLKGSLGNFGAGKAVGTAQRLEAMGHRCDLAGSETASAELEREIAGLRTSLAELIEERVT